MEDFDELLGDIEKGVKVLNAKMLLGGDADPEEVVAVVEGIEDFEDDVKVMLEKRGVPESDRIVGLLTNMMLANMVDAKNDSD